MQAADAHEVGHPGDAEQLPSLTVDGSLVTHRQCRQHARSRGVGHAQQDRVSPVLAQPLQRVGCGDLQPLRARAHVAGGSQVLLKEPALEVKAVRIDGAVRAFQAHRQAPTVTRHQRYRRSAERGVDVPPLKPSQRDALRHAHRRPVGRRPPGALHLEDEAQAYRTGARQRGHRASEHQVLPFQRGFQRLLQAGGGPQVGVGPAQAEQAGQQQGGSPVSGCSQMQAGGGGARIGE